MCDKPADIDNYTDSFAGLAGLFCRSYMCASVGIGTYMVSLLVNIQMMDNAIYAIVKVLW